MRYLMFAVLLCLLPSCLPAIALSNRDYFDDRVIDSLIVNETTQAEILERFSEPVKITFLENGVEVWEYQFEFFRSKRHNSKVLWKTKVVYLLFNSLEILIKKREAVSKKDYRIHNSNNTTFNDNLENGTDCNDNKLDMHQFHMLLNNNSLSRHEIHIMYHNNQLDDHMYHTLLNNLNK